MKRSSTRDEPAEFMEMLLPTQARREFGGKLWAAMMAYMHTSDDWPEDSPFPKHLLQNMADAIRAYGKL